MNENVFIGCYWSARKENRAQCAKRIAACFESLKNVESLTSWFVKGKSRKASEVPLDTSTEGIEEKLRINKRDTDHSVIKELGFSFSAWNGSMEKSASIAVTCGGFSNFVKNSAVVNLPPMTSTEVISRLDAFEDVLSTMVKIWDPEFAVLTSNEYIMSKGGGMPWEVGGWLTYQRGGQVRR